MMAGSAAGSLTEKTGWLVTYWAGPTAPAVLSVILKPSRSILKTATPFFFMRSMSVRISLMSTVEVGFLLSRHDVTRFLARSRHGIAETENEG